jgi:hypothetical protein
MPVLHCHRCGTAAEIDLPLARDAECESCGRDLRCCLNCRHYAPGYNNACRETEAEPVVDKDRRNFCEYFDIERGARGAGAPGSRAADARAKLDAMFGGGRPPGMGKTSGSPFGAAKEDRSAEARKKLEGLFGGNPDDES